LPPRRGGEAGAPPIGFAHLTTVAEFRAMFAELMGVVGMANETNRLASGYQVEIDEPFQT
jgi:hypothetical protein